MSGEGDASLTIAEMRALTTRTDGWQNIESTPPPLGEVVYLRGSDFMGHWFAKASAKLKGDPAFQAKHSKRRFTARVKWCDQQGNQYEMTDAPDEWMPLRRKP